MDNLLNFLQVFRNDIFKLLPMKEAEIEGAQNHLTDYLDSLIINARGSVVTFPELSNQKQFLYVINNLSFLMSNTVSFDKWRKVVLSATRGVDDIYITLGGVKHGQKC